MLSAQLGEPHFLSMHLSRFSSGVTSLKYFQTLGCNLLLLPVSPGHFAGVSYVPERALIQCLCTPTILEEGWEEPRETGSHLTSLACSLKTRVAWPWSFPPVLACIPNHSMLDLYALHIGVLLPRLQKDGELSFKGQLLLCLRAEVFPRVPGRAMAPSSFYGFKFPVLAPPSTCLSPLSP